MRSREGPAIRHRRVALAGLLGLVLIGIGLSFLFRHDGAVAPDGPSADVGPDARSPSFLAVPPGGASPPAKGEAAPDVVDQGRSLVHPENPVEVAVPGIDIDDPMLPTERFPLDVTVVGPDGRPVRFAAIKATWGDWNTKSATADADGHVVMRVPRGTRKLEVWGSGAEEEDPRPFLWVHYQTLDSDETPVRVVVRTGSSISGKLVDPAGAPIAAAHIRAFPEAFGFNGVATDSEGRFRLGVLEKQVVDVCFDSEPEDQPVEVDPNDFPPGPGDGGTKAAKRRGVRRAIAKGVPAGTTDVRLVAETVAVDADVDVTVRGPNGSPVAGAICGVLYGMARVGGKTDASGRAHLKHLPRWELSLDVTPPDSDVASGAPLLPRRLEGVSPDGGAVSVVLEATENLRGRVVDSHGRPAVGASCASRSGLSYLGGTRTSDDGRFVMPSRAPLGARVQLVVTYPGNTLGRPVSRAVVDAVVGGGDLAIVLDEVPAAPAPSR